MVFEVDLKLYLLPLDLYQSPIVFNALLALSYNVYFKEVGSFEIICIHIDWFEILVGVEQHSSCLRELLNPNFQFTIFFLFLFLLVEDFDFLLAIKARKPVIVKFVELNIFEDLYLLLNSRSFSQNFC